MNKRAWRTLSLLLSVVSLLLAIGTIHAQPDGPITPQAELTDIVVTKTATAELELGQFMNVTLFATNNGVTNYTGLEVYDRLPTGYGKPTPITAGGVYIAATNTISWSIDLAPGQTRSFTFTSKATRDGTLSNKVYKACYLGVCSLQQPPVDTLVTVPDPQVEWVIPPSLPNGPVEYSDPAQMTLGFTGVGQVFTMTMTRITSTGVITTVLSKRVDKGIPIYNEETVCFFGKDSGDNCLPPTNDIAKRLVVTDYTVQITAIMPDGRSATKERHIITKFGNVYLPLLIR